MSDLPADPRECNGPRDCVGTEQGCRHCDPGGYAACATCGGLGISYAAAVGMAPPTENCPDCGGSGVVRRYV